MSMSPDMMYHPLVSSPHRHLSSVIRAPYEPINILSSESFSDLEINPFTGEQE